MAFSPELPRRRPILELCCTAQVPMDNQVSPQTSLRSAATKEESDGENDQYYSDQEGSGGDPNANGDGPRKRQRRPMSVS